MGAMTLVQRTRAGIGERIQRDASEDIGVSTISETPQLSE